MKRSIRPLFLSAAVAACMASTAHAQTLSGISSKMTGVAGELGKLKTGEPVQKDEKAIVSDLDAIIAALEKECQACKNGIKKNNPNSPLADSVIRGGTGGIGDLAEPGKGNKDWAKLSDRERDRILQSMTEGFPPEYQVVLERYYRRLAEEKSAAGSPAAPAKADATRTETP
ncbi:hypothetical protein EP7_003211 [Isosphaeraceae bacterium EP7]